jgi:hypothetical protein
VLVVGCLDGRCRRTNRNNIMQARRAVGAQHGRSQHVIGSLDVNCQRGCPGTGKRVNHVDQAIENDRPLRHYHRQLDFADLTAVDLGVVAKGNVLDGQPLLAWGIVNVIAQQFVNETRRPLIGATGQFGKSRRGRIGTGNARAWNVRHCK